MLLINVTYLVLFLVKLPEAESMYMLTYVFKTLVIKIRVSQMIAIFEVTIVCLCCVCKCGKLVFFQSQLRNHEREQHSLPDIFSTTTASKPVVSNEVDEREGTVYLYTRHYKKSLITLLQFAVLK